MIIPDLWRRMVWRQIWLWLERFIAYIMELFWHKWMSGMNEMWREMQNLLGRLNLVSCIELVYHVLYSNSPTIKQMRIHEVFMYNSSHAIHHSSPLTKPNSEWTASVTLMTSSKNTAGFAFVSVSFKVLVSEYASITVFFLSWQSQRTLQAVSIMLFNLKSFMDTCIFFMVDEFICIPLWASSASLASLHQYWCSFFLFWFLLL